MKLEDQVVSLELAKKLKELGVKQESLFWWHECQRPEDGHVWSYIENYYRIDTDRAFEEVVAAFTVAELGEMLPPGRKSWRYTDFDGCKWMCEQVGHHEEAATEADARAKMLIYLIENKLVDPKQE